MDGWGILISRGLSPREVSNSPFTDREIHGGEPWGPL